MVFICSLPLAELRDADYMTVQVTGPYAITCDETPKLVPGAVSNGNPYGLTN